MSIRMRHTKGHSGNRRSHHALKNRTIVTDKASGALRLPHRLDETTGVYRGNLIVAPRVKAEKAPRAKTPKLSEKEHQHIREIDRAEQAQKPAAKGIMGKIAAAARPKARSGAGGGGV